jgi:hypothetical protein
MKRQKDTIVIFRIGSLSDTLVALLYSVWR